MFSFKRSLIALIGLFVIVVAVATLMPLVGRGQGDIKNPLNRDPRKSYYLTQSEHNGSQALSACAEGYHMASLSEIRETSNVRYNTVLGLTYADSGFGPPTNQTGWIRTGAVANASSNPGFGNCNAWMSASSMDEGTIVAITPTWDSADVTVISPWLSSTSLCNSNRLVWCMQD